MASKRTKKAITRNARRSERGKPGKGKSKYAIRMRLGSQNNPRSPFYEGVTS